MFIYVYIHAIVWKFGIVSFLYIFDLIWFFENNKIFYRFDWEFVYFRKYYLYFYIHLWCVLGGE